MSLDREMLATDLAAVLSEAHGIDVDSDDVKRGLDAFLDAVKPVDPHKAVARVSAFLRTHDAARGERTDEYADLVAEINDERLLASDLRAMVTAFPSRRSLREKLAAQGKVAPVEPRT
jgi:hypothetical protein